jgi:DNA polymerase-1
MREDAHLLLQVHDELVYEVRNEKVTELAKNIQRIMETTFTDEQRNNVPILAEAKAGPNWGALELLANQKNG